MKELSKLALLTIASGAFLAASAQAQVLFTTSDDFTGWATGWSGTPSPSTSWSWDTVAINGLGNNPGNTGGSINPGATTSSGSLTISGIQSGSFWGAVAWTPGEGYNPYFMHAIDPGSLAAYTAESGYGSGTAVAHTGTIQLVYTLPDDESGGNGYFEPGIGLNYDGNFAQFFPDNGNPVAPGSIVFLGQQDGLDTYQATIPYSINATSLSYFTLAVWANENYSPFLPFQVDQIEVVATPEPGSFALVGLGLLAFRLFRRRN